MSVPYLPISPPYLPRSQLLGPQTARQRPLVRPLLLGKARSGRHRRRRAALALHLALLLALLRPLAEPAQLGGGSVRAGLEPAVERRAWGEMRGDAGEVRGDVGSQLSSAAPALALAAAAVAAAVPRPSAGPIAARNQRERRPARLINVN